MVYSVGSTALHLHEAAEAWWYQVRSLASVVLCSLVLNEDILLSQSIDLLRHALPGGAPHVGGIAWSDLILKNKKIKSRPL